jgi:hypothetical protein
MLAEAKFGAGRFVEGLNCGTCGTPPDFNVVSRFCIIGTVKLKI